MDVSVPRDRPAQGGPWDVPEDAGWGCERLLNSPSCTCQLGVPSAGGGGMQAQGTPDSPLSPLVPAGQAAQPSLPGDSPRGMLTAWRHEVGEGGREVPEKTSRRHELATSWLPHEIKDTPIQLATKKVLGP